MALPESFRLWIVILLPQNYGLTRLSMRCKQRLKEKASLLERWFSKNTTKLMGFGFSWINSFFRPSH